MKDLFRFILGSTELFSLVAVVVCTSIDYENKQD